MATDEDEAVSLKQKIAAIESVSKSLVSGLAIISKGYHVIWANSYLQPVMQTFGGPDKKCYQIFNHLNSVCPDCGVKKIFEQNATLDVHEYQTIDEKGQILWLELRATPLKDTKGVVTAAFELIVPITERKKTEEALRQSEETYKALINGMNDTAWVIDFGAHFIDVNEAAVRVLGYSRSELLSMGPSDIDSSLSKAQISALARRMPSDKKQVFETSHTTKDGKIIPVEVSSSLITYQGKQAILSIARNITELKKAQAKLSAAHEKLQVVGKLTRHDVRNKLSSINAITYLLKKKIGSDPEVAKYLASIESAVAVSNRLFELSELYEKIGAEELTEITVKNCFDEAVALIPNLGNVRVINESDGLTVVADSLLRQIFYNLLDNSLKHGEKVTQIRLYYEKEGDQIKLYYDDDGVGVSVEDKPKLFSEGFSIGDGSGLGLSMIKKIIEVYKWSIHEIGLPGKGVTFEITIPIQQSRDTSNVNRGRA